MEKVFVLYNPFSNNNRGLETAQVLKATSYGKELEFIDITTIEDYKTFFSNLSSTDQVIVCGGDGTLNKFINYTKGIEFRNEIQYMPTGTGNDFYKEVSEGASTPIRINEYIKNLPICEINGEEYNFIDGVGYGIDGYCCEVGDELKTKSTKPINYTAIAIKGLLFHYKPASAKIIVDGVEHNFKNVWLAPVMKGKYYGGGMIPCPNQNRKDETGKLSVLVFCGKSRLNTLMIFPSIFKGEHVKKTKYVTVLEGYDITVSYDQPKPAQIDGETVKGVSSIHCYAKK